MKEALLEEGDGKIYSYEYRDSKKIQQDILKPILLEGYEDKTTWNSTDLENFLFALDRDSFLETLFDEKQKEVLSIARAKQKIGFEILNLATSLNNDDPLEADKVGQQSMIINAEIKMMLVPLFNFLLENNVKRSDIILEDC